MDELRRHAAPVIDRWQRFGRCQRIGIVAALITSAAGYVVLLNRSAESWQPIASGREFSTTELNAIQSAWRQSGLKSFRRDGRRLLVPLADVARYTAALPSFQQVDGDFSNRRGQAVEKANLFTNHEQFEQLKDAELRETLCRNLKAIPAIADADVIWARGKGRSGFASRTKVTATITVLPRVGHEITPELALSLRTAVAGMIPDLNAQDIVVLDQSTGLTMAIASEKQLDEQKRRRQQESLARRIESRIATALSHFPNVAVQAKLVETPRPQRRHTAARPTFGSSVVWTSDAPDNLVEFPPLVDNDDTQPNATVPDFATSGAWHVAVQIPQASFDAHIVQQLLTTEHRTENFDELCDAECAHLRVLVQNLLPPDASLAEMAIVPRTATTPTIQPAASFTAWPHIVCGLLAVFCLTTAARCQQMSSTSSLTAGSLDRTPTDSSPLDGFEPTAHQVDEGLAVMAAPSPSSPPTDVIRLQQLDPRTLADVLRHERPQAIAVLMTRFPTRLASSCLSRFSPSMQTDVIRRLKSLGDVPDELVGEIARAVQQRMNPSSSEAGIHEPTNRIAQLLPESPAPRAIA